MSFTNHTKTQMIKTWSEFQDNLAVFPDCNMETSLTRCRKFICEAARSTPCTSFNDRSFGPLPIQDCGPCTERQGRLRCAFGLLWLEFHKFWEKMIALQPNDFSSGSELGEVFRAHAVELLCDIASMRVKIEAGEHGFIGSVLPMEKLETILGKLDVFEWDLILKSDHLCGCTYDLKRLSDKTKLWTRFGEVSGKGKYSHFFCTRDVACLLGLDDFIECLKTHAKTSNHKPPDALTLYCSLDHDIREYFGSPDGITEDILLERWCQILEQPEFRAQLNREVKKMIDEAVALSEENRRYGGHDKDCEAYGLAIGRFHQKKATKFDNERRRFYEERMLELDAQRPPPQYSVVDELAGQREDEYFGLQNRDSKILGI